MKNWSIPRRVVDEVDEQLVIFGELLYARRRERGLSLRHLARETGMSPAYLQTLEKAKNPKTGRPSMPSYTILGNLARVLNLESEIYQLINEATVSGSAADPFKMQFKRLVKETLYSVTQGLLPRAHEIIAKMEEETLEEAERAYRELRGPELSIYVGNIRNRDYVSEFVRRIGESREGTTAGYSLNGDIGLEMMKSDSTGKNTPVL